MSQKSNQLDLSQVENEDLEGLAKRIEEHYRADSDVKSSLAYHWERNHHMLDGRQWIVYDGQRGAGGQWKQLQVNKANEYIPRPVTNYLFDIYQTLKSYLIQNKPRSTVVPNTQEYKDKEAAKLANLVCEANWERLKEEKNYEYAAATLVTYGTVFKKDYWDTSSIMMAKVPMTHVVPETDPMTGQVIGEKEIEVTDPETGEIQYQEIPLGDVNTAVVEPYRIVLDPLATDIHSTRWILEYSIQPLDWIKEVYSRQEEGYTGFAEQLKPEEDLSSSMSRFYNMKNSSGVKTGGLGSSNGSGDGMVENAAVVKEYYEAPSRRHPKGRLVVVANGKTLYAGESPYSGPELGDWHPYSEARWEVVPGRFWGKSPLDAACEIQKHINSIDAAIVLTRKTMAVPQKLIPKSSGIKPGEWTGRPGQEIQYRDGGAAPTTVPASGVDPQVFQERAQRVEDLKAVTGAIDILKGDKPAGVDAASALELLFEVGTGKLRPSLDRWKVFVEGSQKKQLRCVANKYREPRPEFIKMLHSRNKETPKEVINSFIGADLHDNCNVRIEAGSNIPKLQSAEKSQLLQLAQIGTLNLENPENKMEFNRRLGIIGFDNEAGPDVKRASWENALMENIVNNPNKRPVVFADEDHATHKEIHMRRMKEPSFMELDEEVQNIFTEHMAEHDQMIQMQEQMEMEKAMALGVPPQQKQGKTQVPVQGAGKGVSQDQSEKAFGLPKGVAS